MKLFFTTLLKQKSTWEIMPSETWKQWFGKNIGYGMCIRLMFLLTNSSWMKLWMINQWNKNFSKKSKILVPHGQCLL